MVASPFPGMDPYLEAPDLWEDVHIRLVNIFAEQLAPQLAPNYLAELDTKLVIEHIEDEDLKNSGALPDVAVTQPKNSTPVGITTLTGLTPTPLRLKMALAAEVRLVSLYVRRPKDRKLVAAIELLSPINKRPGIERRKYIRKRTAYVEKGVHLIEIDLLRSYPRMPFEEDLPACDYLMVVSDAYEWPECNVWPLKVRQPLPTIPVPLLRPDPPAALNISQALRTAYERARYDLRIDYTQLARPPLSAEDTAWMAALLGQQRNGQTR